MGGESLLEKDNVDRSRMGLGNWRPDWLQHFNSMKWYLAVLSLASLTQGIQIF